MIIPDGMVFWIPVTVWQTIIVPARYSHHMNNWKSVAAVLLGLLFLVTICAAEGDQFMPKLNTCLGESNPSFHAFR